MTRRKAQPEAPTTRSCDRPGCDQPGAYRAPRSPAEVENAPPAERYYHFCLEHVREYNQKWDYFAQMSLEEIERFQRDAVVGHRKTKPIGAPHRHAHSPFFAQQDAWFFGFHPQQPEAKAKPAEAPTQLLHRKEREAIALLNLPYPFTQAELKARYRAAVKKTHPDANREDPQAEMRFREVTEAYRLLQKISI